MDEGHQLLESFGQHEMPDLWPDIQERSLRVEMVAESPRGTIPSPLRGHFRLVLGIMATALAIALLGVVALWPKGTRTPNSLEPNVRLVVFTTEDNKITARITDPLAAAGQLSAVFQQHRLNITVRAIPVSPSLVGTIVYSDVPSIRSLHEGTCLGGGTSCEVGIVIPGDFHGQANVVVGRAAQTNETFRSSADVFGPGEVLHCSGILGRPVADAIPVLQRRSLTVRWLAAAAGPTTTGSPPSGYVVSGTALSSSTVLLDVTPELLDTPDFRSFQALANQGC
jgi:hypothetical protein